MEEQERRFKARIDDPLRQWKLSPMDTESYGPLVRLLAGARHDARPLIFSRKVWKAT
jgi:hypothetical protein